MPVGIGVAFSQALLGAGFALRVFTPPELLSLPFWNALPTLLFAIALSLCGLLDQRFAVDRRLYWPSALLTAFAVMGARFGDDQSLSIALELLGLWCFALQVSAAPHRALFPLILPLAWLGISGLAEATWLHTATAAALQGIGSESVAALSSRAAGPFLNANVFAGAMLFAMPLAGYWILRGRVIERLLAACLIAGFLAAMSLGGVIALLAALTLGKGSTKGLRVAALALLLLALAALFAEAAGLGLGLSTKLASLEERWDYWQTGFALLRLETVFGTGFGSYADLSRDALTPGQAYSRHAHCGPLEWGIEGGLFFGAVIAGLLAVLRPLSGRCDREAKGSNPRAGQIALAMGVALGGGLAICQFPARSPFPAAVPSLICAALFAGGTALLCARNSGAPLDIPRRPLALGVLAMALHGVIDFDWSIAPHRAVLFLGLGVLLGPSGQQGTARPAQGRRAIAFLAAILALFTAFALSERQRALAEQRTLAASAPERGRLRVVGAPRWPHCLLREGAIFRHLESDDLLRRFEALPEGLRFRRSVREAAIAALLQKRPKKGTAAMQPWAKSARHLLGALDKEGRHLSANAATLEVVLAESAGDLEAASLWRARAAARGARP